MKPMSQLRASMRPPARVVPPEVSAQRQQDAARRLSEMTQQRPGMPPTMVPPMVRPQMPVMPVTATQAPMKKGGKVKKAKGGSVSSASKRADGVAQRGKTRGKFV